MGTDLRMLIDKFQKTAGKVQAYEDSDLMEYLKKGQEWINAFNPVTCWDRSNGSPLWVVTQFWIMAAAWYGLTAQHLLEVDLSFSFSGLTTTLDMDRTGGIESAIARMYDYMDNQFKPLKMRIFRRTRGMGHTGVRAFGAYQHYNNYVYKVHGPGGAGNATRVLEELGLFR